MSQKNEHPVRDMIFSDLGKIAKVLGAVAGTVGAAMISSAGESVGKEDTNFTTDSHRNYEDDPNYYRHSVTPNITPDHTPDMTPDMTPRDSW
ncbi:hypothetical protein [Carnimonas bestiolae]|uniref:hypothetical protein n=1 Tax=Carnimonas bestiolae TaxID=3402172 RepID=UPI003EDBB572